MRRFTVVLLYALACGAASAGLADERDIFASLDTNSNGQLSDDEIDSKHQRLFQRLLRTADENDDGQLSEQEFVTGTTRTPDAAEQPRFNPGRGPARGNSAPRFDLQQVLTRLDRNGDQKLSKEEAPERMRENFDRLDQNSDGFIDAAEVRRITTAMRDRVQPNAPRPPAADNGRMAEMAQRIFKQRDVNNDGKVSLNEIPEQRRDGFRRLLQQFDVDPEQGLNEKQFTEAISKLLERREQP